MPNKLRFVLAPILTILLVMQTVAPVVLAQDETSGDQISQPEVVQDEGTPEDNPGASIEEQPILTEEPVETLEPEPVVTPIPVWLPVLTPVSEATCETGPVLNEQSLLEIPGVQSAYVEGEIVAGGSVLVKLNFVEGFAFDPNNSANTWWLDVDGLTAVTSVVFAPAPADDVCIPQEEESTPDNTEGDTESPTKTPSTPEQETEAPSAPEQEAEAPSTPEQEAEAPSTPEQETEAPSTPEQEVEAPATPDADDQETTVLVSLPVPDSLVETDEQNAEVVNFDSLEVIEGVESVRSIETDEIEQAPEEAENSDEKTVQVEVTLAEGHELDEANSPEWEVGENNTAVANVSLQATPIVAPLAIAPGSGIVNVTAAPLELETIDDSVRFDFEWLVLGDPTLVEGDAFTFTVANYGLLGIGAITADDPIPLIGAGGLIYGYVTIDETGNGNVVLNENVNGAQSASGTFYFETEIGWARDLQEVEDQTIDFDVTQDDETFPIPIVIPGRGEEPDDPPGTEPSKDGWFRFDDQGRVEREGAINWRIRAPEGGPTEQVVITDTVPEGAGWEFDCDNITYENGDAELIDVECTPTSLTITFGAYHAETWETAPGIRIRANITDTANDADPYAENLQFENGISSITYVDGEEFGTGEDSYDIQQRGTGVGENPTKSGEFTRGDQGRSEPEGAILWTVQAPAGPADSVILTDNAPEGWVFDCSQVTPLHSGGWDNVYNSSTWTVVSCSETQLVVSIGAYRSFGEDRPGFQVVANVTADPFPDNLPREIHTFTNGVSSEVVPRGGGDPVSGSADAELPQTPPAEPASTPDKSGRFTRRDNGEFVQEGALEWTIVLPPGPNGGVILTDTAGANWQFDCGDANAGVTVEGEAPTSIDCTAGSLTVTYEEGYSSASPVITVRATITSEFEVGQDFTNTADVQVRDYLTDDNFGEDGWTSGTDSHTSEQSRYQGGTGEIGEFEVSIGDYIWYDTNLDGLQDADELPAAGIPVTLYAADGETVIATTVTDEFGYYWFTGLDSDQSYVLEFGKPDGYEWTTQDAGDDAADSDVDPATNRIPFVAPTMGANQGGANITDNPTLDGGLVKLVSIGDYVWYDRDRNGVQDAGEAPVEGVVVTLYDADGNVIGTTTTDETGYYNFQNLYPGRDYYLIFEQPESYDGWTTQNAGDDDAIDSDVDPATGRVDFTAPTGGDNATGPDAADDPTLDAGLVRNLVSIGDYVWYDENRDGIQDADETPVSGVVITLYDADGNVVATTTTDDNGYYYFADLEPGTDYYLIFEKPDGYAGWTTQDAGDDAADSDVDPETGRIDFTSPASGNNQTGPGEADNPTLDAGLVRLVSIGDKVWYDTDRDGVQDEDEPPAEGIVVILYDTDGNEVARTTTDANGYYYFQDLLPDTEYSIIFERPEGYEWTSQNAGSDDGADSDVDPFGEIRFTTPSSGNNQIGPGEADDPTLDAGLVIIEEGTPNPTETPDPTETPVTPDPTETPVTPDPTETPVTPDPTETPVTPDPTETPATPDPTEVPATPDPTQAPGTVTPTPQSPVTGLPDTGAGNGQIMGWMLAAVASMALMAIGLRMNASKRS